MAKELKQKTHWLNDDDDGLANHTKGFVSLPRANMLG